VPEDTSNELISEDVTQALPKGKKTCHVCQKVVNCSNYARHVKTHVKSDKVYCYPCNQYFTNNQGFVNHCKSKKHKRLVTDERDDNAPDSLLTSTPRIDVSSESTECNTVSRGQFFLVT
jgi:hypothetical protein